MDKRLPFTFILFIFMAVFNEKQDAKVYNGKEKNSLGGSNINIMKNEIRFLYVIDKFERRSTAKLNW